MRIAIVVARYGEEIRGGAEVLARGLAENAARRGAAVEVWTTCARDHYTWQNVHPAGASTLNGVLVRRFPVRLWNLDQHALMEERLAAQGRLSPADQLTWLESGVHSPALYQHVAAHAHAFDAVLALPYTQALVHYAAWVAPGRVFVIPCLHDEPYAYLEPTRLLLEGVRGVLYNSPEEGDLTQTRLGIRPRRAAVLGLGVGLAEAGRLAQSFPARPLLYVGRLEEGKNVLRLYEYARRYADQHGRLHLVVAGTGPVVPPAHPAITFLGSVSEAEKAALYAAGLALAQPSLNESFSLTMMESWLAGRPVIVHGGCAVTRGHVRRSQGGLWFSTYEEFGAVLDWLYANPELAARMGQNGRDYVQRNYTWDVVVDRLEKLLRQWSPSSAAREKVAAA